MGPSWCKVASNLDSHPKIRKAGRLGREVFLFALRRNAEPGNPVPGRLPKDELESWYLAGQLMMTEEEAVTGVTCAVTAGLLAVEGLSYLIVPWKDAWGRDNANGAERTRKWRDKKRNHGTGDTRDNGDERDSHGDSGDTEEKRREETTSQVDLDLTIRLWNRILKNNPKADISRLPHAKAEERKHAWAVHVRRMREIDKHEPEEIAQVIDWSQSDPFWLVNIRSTETLRKQWDQLVLKMRSGKPAARQITVAAPADDTPPLFLLKGMGPK